MEKVAKLLEARLQARRELIDPWPYDPRGAPPSRPTTDQALAVSHEHDLQLALTDELEMLRWIARQAEVRFADVERRPAR